MANPDVTPNLKATKQLFAAIQKNQLADVDAAIKAGADIHFYNKRYYDTPLGYAAEKGNIKIVERLLKEKGVDVNHPNVAGRTPLISAAIEGHAEIGKLLIQKGADKAIDEQDKLGWRALTAAGWQGHTDFVQLLIEENVDVTVTDTIGTPLMHAVRSNHPDTVRVLAKAGLSVDARDMYNYTPLMRAAERGYTDMTRVLIDLGADVNASTKAGTTALKLALLENHFDTSQILVDQKADVNAGNGNQTLLEAALNNLKDTELKQSFFLLEHGADASRVSEKNQYFAQSLNHVVAIKREILASSATAPSLNNVLYDLLDKHNGVFLGETHSGPSVRQSLVHLMPGLKAHGVKTLSVELKPEEVDDMLKYKTADEWYENTIFKITKGHHPKEFFALVHAANSYGIKVIGHEKGRELPLVERNEWAAEYINDHKDPDGKVLVFGGEIHSWEGKKMFEDKDIKDREYGLDTLLNIPAINMVWDEALTGKVIPSIENHSLNVLLPSNLKEYIKEHGVNSWHIDREAKTPVVNIPQFPNNNPDIPPMDQMEIEVPKTPVMRPQGTNNGISNPR